MVGLRMDPGARATSRLLVKLSAISALAISTLSSATVLIALSLVPILIGHSSIKRRWALYFGRNPRQQRYRIVEMKRGDPAGANGDDNAWTSIQLLGENIWRAINGLKLKSWLITNGSSLLAKVM